MTLSDIKALVVSVDPTAAHYDSAHRKSDAYTVWREYQRTGLFADNGRPNKSWRFKIHLVIVRNEWVLLQGSFQRFSDGVILGFCKPVDLEPDSGFIHHIFDCEAAGA